MILGMATEQPGGEEWTRRRKARSLAIALGLGALVVMFYVATLVRLGPNAIKKDGFSDLPSKKNFKVPDAEICKRAGTC